MGNNEILNANVKAPQKPNTSPEDLAKQLGQVVTKPEAPVSAPSATVQPVAVVAPEAKPETRYDKLYKGLTADQKATVDSLPEAHREKVAESFFSLAHPFGLIEDFKKAVVVAIEKIAKENLVKLVGMDMIARFPVGEGLVPNVELASVGTYEAKAEGKSKTKTAGESTRGFGKVTLSFLDGRVEVKSNMTEAAHALGMATSKDASDQGKSGYLWHDSSEYITNPRDLNDVSLKLPVRWAITSSEPGKAISFKQIAD